MAERRAPRLTAARRRVLDRMLDSLLDHDAEARKRALDRLASTHPRLHRHLSRLVEASATLDNDFGTLIQRIGSAALSTLDAADEPLPGGTRIGDWRIIEPIGAGGMGLVYRAERADGAFEMQTAIKFIRSRANRKLGKRLVLERQLLARLDHPNIARIIDGGTLADGQGFLVMEWIDGEDLTECRDRTADDGERCVALFLEIAAAVGHAHQRRVVHGDIKPANVRIAPDGRVRLLDFGVARLITEVPEPENLGAMTPAFSAPEQRSGEPASTQTDIYALGALLRWMLTGDPGSEQVTTDFRPLDVPRPAALAAIVDRAMAAEPAARYPSVSELTSDLRAWLEYRPVDARPAGSMARLGLWAFRHRLAAALTGITCLAVIGAAAGLAWQAGVVRAERDMARFEAERSALLREQMVLLFREVGQNSDAGDISARDLLDESTRVAERLHANDPQMLASVKAFLGEIYIAMDDFAAAEPLLEAFVEHNPNDSDLLTAFVLADLAQVRLRQGEAARAAELTAASLAQLKKRPGNNDIRIADVLQIHGQALRGMDRWDEAITTLRLAHELARTEPAPSRLRATTANNLGTTLIYAGKNVEAEPYLQTALENWRGLDLENGSNALTVMGNLAGLLHQRGEADESMALYRETIERRRARFGESGALAAVHLNLGTLLAQHNRIDEARREVEAGLAMMMRFEGPDSINYGRARLARARVELAGGELERALEEFVAVRQRFADQLGAAHLMTGIAELYAAIARTRSSPGTSEVELEGIVERLAAHGGAAERFRAHGHCELAHARMERNPDQAATSADECLDIRSNRVASGPAQVAEARLLLGSAQWRQGRHDQSIRESLISARRTMVERLGADHPNVRRSLRWIEMIGED